jgi:large subunit ribosomal protein L16
MIFNWQPRQTKFKRLHKGKIKKCRFKRSARTTQDGICGLIILKSMRLTVKQLEQARRKIMTVRKKKEKQKIWTRCVSDTAITAKPLGIRMGKGKGAIKYWVHKAVAGKIIFHLSPRALKRAKTALEKAKKILPIPTKIYVNRTMLRRRIKFKKKC